MKFSGDAILSADPSRVWEAFHDPAVLARTLPGCEALEALGDDQFRLTMSAGVSAVRGRYDGEVSLTEQQHPDSFVLKARGAGAPGTISADVLVRLAAGLDGGTSLSYEADAIVGGPIGGVGQRMLTGVSRKMAEQFFTAVDRDIAGLLAAGAPAGPAGAVGRGEPPAEPWAQARPGEGVATAGPAAYAGRVPVRAAGRDFALGAAVGGLVALAGVVVGAAIGRRTA